MKQLIAVITMSVITQSAYAISPCPLKIEPSKSLGPFHIGQKSEEVQKIVAEQKNSFKPEAVRFFKWKMLNVKTCNGFVDDIWVDDIRKHPKCFSFQGKLLPSKAPKEEIMHVFGDCKEQPPRFGGVFSWCANKGIYLGWGSGNFLQLRVRSTPLDEDCTQKETE